MDESEFRQRCLDTGGLRPLPSVTERERFAREFHSLSEKKLSAARTLRAAGHEQMAVGEAYFAMEHRANELLALAGFRSKNHVCTQTGLARLVDEKTLATILSHAYQDRQTFDYTDDPATMVSADDVPSFFLVVDDFLNRIDLAIGRRRHAIG